MEFREVGCEYVYCIQMAVIQWSAFVSLVLNLWDP
jgi:hypothetical protein